jgi:pectate lyase
MHWAGDAADPEGGAVLDLRNNVAYDCGGQQLLRAELEPASGFSSNLVGNYGKSGPATPAESMMFGLNGSPYLEDNVYEGQSMILTPYFGGEQATAPHELPAVATTTAAQAYEDVLDWAGAWPRDAMAARTVAEVRAGTGVLGKQDDAPLVSDAAPPADADLDGMPDAWETERGLDPDDASDAASLTTSGYTEIEVYLAERADALIGA